eukprot:gene5574-6263_t
MAKSRGMDDKHAILGSQESIPQQMYPSAKPNQAYESDTQSTIQSPPRKESKEAKPYIRSLDHMNSMESIDKRESDYGMSICLCTASVYPHFHRDAIIDDEVYDEIMIVEPNQLQKTSKKRDTRRKVQCMKLCKIATIMIIIFVGIACALYSTVHYFTVNKSGTTKMGQADAKLLHYSTYFCERVGTSRADIARNLSVLQDKQGSIAEFTTNQTTSIELSSAQRTYEHEFYAITQSKMQIIVATNADVQIMVFDDKDKLEAWRSNKNYQSYEFKRTCCKSIIIHRGVYNFTTKQDKHAFVVLYAPTATKINVNLTLLFHKMFTGYKAKPEICSAAAGGSCSVPVSFASKDRVVIEVPIKAKAFEPRKVEWHCVARVWFYVLVFLGIFLVFMLIMLLIYCVFKHCYIVPRQRHGNASPQYAVQYQKNASLSRQRAAYTAAGKVSTTKGPRAEHMRQLQRYDSNDSIDKHPHTPHEANGHQGLTAEDRRRLKAKQQTRRMNSVNSTTTSHSVASAALSHAISMSSIGSDVKKRGMDLDDSYEELPHLYQAENEPAADIGQKDSVVYAVPEIYDSERGQSDDDDDYDEPLDVIKLSDSKGHLAASAKRSREGQCSKGQSSKSDDDDDDDEYDVVGSEIAIDSPNGVSMGQRHHSSRSYDEIFNTASKKSNGRQNDQRRRIHSSMSDEYYDVVGMEISRTPSKLTAHVIDVLPLGPSGAPPRAPPASAESLKGGRDFQKPMRKMGVIGILPNGFTRDENQEKPKQRRSNEGCRNGAIKREPARTNVIVLTGKEKRNADLYSTYQRQKRGKEERVGNLNRFSKSLDSGLDQIDGYEIRRLRPIADVKF